MRFESGLEFGKHANMINEAYQKMINESGQFLFGNNRSSSGRLPSWLEAEAARHGHKFDPAIFQHEEEEEKHEEAPVVKNDDDEFYDSLLGGSTSDDIVVDTDSEGIEGEEEEDDSLPEDNFYINVIEANPDIFKAPEYDMEFLASHKKELLDTAMEFMMKAHDEVTSAEKAYDILYHVDDADAAVEKIGDSAETTEEDSVGHID